MALGNSQMVLGISYSCSDAHSPKDGCLPRLSEAHSWSVCPCANQSVCIRLSLSLFDPGASSHSVDQKQPTSRRALSHRVLRDTSGAKMSAGRVVRELRLRSLSKLMKHTGTMRHIMQMWWMSRAVGLAARHHNTVY